MGAIDDRSFVPALKTRRPFHIGESASDGGLIHLDLGSTNRSDCGCGVEFLMFAAQRDW